MSNGIKVADPAVGVAQASVATSFGQPGGRILSADDVPELLRQGKSLEEVAALGLMDREDLERQAYEMVQAGELPSERFTFQR
jgi:hypothetical protein